MDPSLKGSSFDCWSHVAEGLVDSWSDDAPVASRVRIGCPI